MGLTLAERLVEKRGIENIERQLLARLDLLEPAERELLTAVLVRGQSCASLARLTGRCPRSLRRLVLRRVRRMSSPQFTFAARSLAYLAPGDAMIARMRFCQGLSVREVARRLRLTHHAARRWADRVRAQIDTLRRIEQPQRYNPQQALARAAGA
jgi:DNA-directed RNA polymerase specialized sigma24 family protein